jgi:hypothetical protein
MRLRYSDRISPVANATLMVVLSRPPLKTFMFEDWLALEAANKTT